MWGVLGAVGWGSGVGHWGGALGWGSGVGQWGEALGWGSERDCVSIWTHDPLEDERQKQD